MADNKLRYTIEVDASGAGPELRQFLADLDKAAKGAEKATGSVKNLGKAFAGANKDIDEADKRLEKSFADFDKTMSKLDKSISRLKQNDASRALTVQLPLWQRLSIAVTGVNQAFYLLDRTVGRAARSLVGEFAAVADEGERLVKLSQRFGIPVDQIAKLDFAARRAGVSVEGMGQGVRTFSVVLEQARSGVPQAVKYFQALGIEGDKLRTITAQGLIPAFITVAQKLYAIKDPVLQAALGSRVFRGAWDELKVALENSNGNLE